MNLRFYLKFTSRNNNRGQKQNPAVSLVFIAALTTVLYADSQVIFKLSQSNFLDHIFFLPRSFHCQTLSHFGRPSSVLLSTWILAFGPCTYIFGSRTFSRVPWTSLPSLPSFDCILFPTPILMLIYIVLFQFVDLVSKLLLLFLSCKFFHALNLKGYLTS